MTAPLTTGDIEVLRQIASLRKDHDAAALALHSSFEKALPRVKAWEALSKDASAANLRAQNSGVQITPHLPPSLRLAIKATAEINGIQAANLEQMQSFALAMQKVAQGSLALLEGLAATVKARS